MDIIVILVDPNEPSDALKHPTFFFQILIPFASIPFSLAQFFRQVIGT